MSLGANEFLATALLDLMLRDLLDSDLLRKGMGLFLDGRSSCTLASIFGNVLLTLIIGERERVFSPAVSQLRAAEPFLRAGVPS